MALDTLKKLWKNEYFQTAITIILILIIVFGFWRVIQFALNTEYPALAVASNSMLPTLNIGDLIIVQGIQPEHIHVGYLDGDIIVFWRGKDLIVHRAIEKENRSDGYYFTFHGDNTTPGSLDKDVNQSRIVGKVVGKIPWLGNFALLMQQYMYLFTIVIIVLIVFFLMFPFEKEENGEEKESLWEMKLFGKISLKLIAILVVNILLIIFIIFSLFGSLTLWQPGANPPQNVSIYGTYSDVLFHESFNVNYNNVHEAFLSHGFLTYTIDCNVSDGSHVGKRIGVPAFSWAQAALIILILFDVWELIKFLKSKKKAEKTEAQSSYN